MSDFQQYATNYVQPGIAGDCAGKRFYPLTSAVALSAGLVNIVPGNFAWIVAGGSSFPVTITPTIGSNTILAGLVVRENPNSNPALGFGVSSGLQIYTGQSCQYATQAYNEIVMIGSVSGSVGIGSIVYASNVDGSIVLSATVPVGATATNYVVTALIGAYGDTNSFIAGQLITISNTASV